MSYFYVTAVDMINRKVSILDTRDNIVETVNFIDAISVAKKGFTIEGMTLGKDNIYHFKVVPVPKRNLLPDIVLSDGGFAPFKPKEKKMLVVALGRRFIEQAKANGFDYDFADGTELENAIRKCTSADGTIIGFKCLINLQHRDTRNAKYPMFTIEFGWNALSNKYYIETYSSMYVNSIRKCRLNSNNYETLASQWFCYDEFVERVNKSIKNAQNDGYVPKKLQAEVILF